jgi:23S rRNA (guanosine2251-2'-O)-methyltransferase
MDSLQKKSMQSLQRLDTHEIQTAERIPVRLVLDQVRSAQNVGALFRTADGFRIQGIDLCGFTPAPPHRDISKTALGAENTVPFRSFSDAETAIQQLLSENFEIWIVEQVHGSISFENWKLPQKPLAVVVGNEIDGVSSPWLNAATGAIEIPQFGHKHSLNVAAAGAIVLWECVRQGIHSRQFAHLLSR